MNGEAFLWGLLAGVTLVAVLFLVLVIREGRGD